MSLTRPGILRTVVSEEDYRQNRERLEQAQATLDDWKAMNEAAKAAYDKQQELLRKVEEGREAERQLQALKNAANIGTPLIAGPSAQSSSTSANYNHQWRSSQSQFASTVGAQAYHENPNTGGYAQPQWQAYGSSSGATQSYAAQGPGSQYHDQIALDPQFQQPPQQYQRTPQVTQPPRPGPAFAQRAGQPQPSASTRVPQANGRSSTAVGGQTISIAQGRQALQMQPVMQRSVHSNQSQAHQAAFVLPSISSRTTVTQPVDQSQGRAQTAAPGSVAAVPNLVDQTPPAVQPYRPPAAPESSSLAGALDATRSGTKFIFVPSSYNGSSSADPLPSLSSLRDTAARLQEQVAKSKTAPSRGITPTENLAPNRPNGTGDIPVASVARPAGASAPTFLDTSKLMDTNAIIKQVTSNPAGMERLHAIVNRWQAAAPPHSYFSLPDSNVKIYKAEDSRVFLVFPLSERDPTKVAYIPFSRLQGPYAPAPAQNVGQSVHQNAYQNDTGNVQHLAEPPTAEQAKKYRPYSILPHTTIQQPARPVALGTYTNTTPGTVSPTAPPSASGAHAASTTPAIASTIPDTPTSSEPLMRTPAQADKKRLAKDLLRALNVTPQKFSQPDDGSALGPSGPSEARYASEHNISALQTSLPTSDPPRPEPTVVVPRTTTTESVEAQQLPVTATVELLDKLPQTEQGGDCCRPRESNSTVEGDPSKPPSIPTAAPASKRFESLASATTIPVGNVVTPPRKVPETLPRSPPTERAASIFDRTFTPPRRQTTPLFLPSPSPSPNFGPTGALIEDISDDQVLDVRSASRQRAKSQSFYVLVPPMPDYVQRYKSQQAVRKRPRLFPPEGYDSDIEMASTAVSTVSDEDVIDTDPASHGFVNDDAEREAVMLSCSRISERPCKWNGCSTVLSSAENLIRHLAVEHAQQATFEGYSVCLWQQCGRHENNSTHLFRHLKNHATIPLLCAYQDCEGSFRTARQLAKHHQDEHSNALLRPSAAIFPPILEPPPDAPGLVPSYLLEQVRPASISKERHANLGPWVLRNIAGPVNLGIRRYNAASKPSRSLTGEGENRIANQPYDFLSFPSTNFSSSPSRPSRIRGLRNLESGEVSEMVHDGMVLWDIPDEPKEEETDELDRSMSSPSPETATEVGEERNKALVTELMEQSSDEEAVEIMLSVS
ncbi:hypothetical protein LshimejAT787_0109950 [Lyophyllum shimeji]|uniref:C2H2-type domain-containing protein n=1 Tax=Lyophyllum shimeji TaxID=47721 RepID=A0A9P3PEP9_LYOSH|nr:hypothetical protein LshimejAT787_0109950 [Lyophyllum shimeji]